MTTLAKEALRRIVEGRHPWHEFVPNDLDRQLIHEYFRRQALWALALKARFIFPMGDIAKVISPDFSFSMHDIFESEINKITKSLDKQELCWWCIKFYELMESRDLLKEFQIPDPCEPLILLLSNGRWIRKETGGIQLGISFFSTRDGAEKFAREKFLDLDEKFDVYR